MKRNFKRFPMFTGIRKEQIIIMDISEQIANMLYCNVPGIAAHVLAEKIYTAPEDGVELNEREVELLNSCKEMVTGSVADSLMAFLNEADRGM